MFLKLKKWILGGTIVMAVVAWLYRIYKAHIENEIRKGKLKKKAKELKKETTDTTYKINKLTTQIDDIDTSIERKKKNLKKLEDKTRNKVVASNLPQDEKLKMFNDLFGNK